MSAPDDGMTDYGDLIVVGNYVSAIIPPAFIESSFSYGLVNWQTCPANSKQVKFTVSGYLTAEAVNEHAVYAPSDANSQLADTAVTVTAAKVVSGSNVSWEAGRFASAPASLDRFGREQAMALARKMDDTFIALFPSFTATATAAGGTLDEDTILEGEYQVYNGNTPPGRLQAVIERKGYSEVKKLIAKSGASVYTIPNNSTILGQPQPNSYVGSYLDIDFYATTGLATTGSYDQGAIFHPLYAFCGCESGGVESRAYWTGKGVASAIPGFSTAIDTWHAYDIDIWHDAAGCELRSNT